MTTHTPVSRRPLIRLLSATILGAALLVALLQGVLPAGAEGRNHRGTSDHAGETDRTPGGAVGGQGATDLAESTAAIINDEPVNLRAEATTEADIIAELSTGTEVTILDGPVSADGYDWYQIEADDGTGWVTGDYLSPADADFAADTTVVVETAALNLRAAAGLDTAILAELPNGSTATIRGSLESVDGYTWYEVETDEGTGWVAGEYLASA